MSIKAKDSRRLAFFDARRSRYLVSVAALLVLLVTTAAGQTQLTPAISFSNTQESTISTTLQNSDVSIPAMNLESGSRYLILYSAAYGSNDATQVPVVAVTYGATSLASGSDEGSADGLPEAMRTGSLHGFYVLTGDGTSDLRIQHRIIGAGTSYIKGKSLVAVPLGNLTENTDYWFAQQNGDAAEVSTTSSFVDLLTMTVNLPEAGDYLVL
ncbi:MAG: hypothetical protein KAT85_09350, partial [candidate division Zixibacteria bacterium]|nr:hypothetical protein [candidate division Zixibacteria bacterium]